MRTPEDAIRSVKKYVAEALSPQYPLAAITCETVVWTFAHQVKGALDVDRATFGWLRSLDRHAPTDEVDGGAHWRSTELAISLDDVLDAADADGVLVPIDGDLVADYALAWQDEWEVRLWAEPGTFTPPFARVMPVPSTATSGPATFYDRAQSMVIECYPTFSDTEEEAQLKALDVDHRLTEAFRGAGVGEGRPLRVPLYDYQGVAATDVATSREDSDFMRVESFSTRPLPDIQDPRRVALVCDLRVSWRQSIDLTELRDSRTKRPVRGTRRVGSVVTEFEVE